MGILIHYHRIIMNTISKKGIYIYALAKQQRESNRRAFHRQNNVHHAQIFLQPICQVEMIESSTKIPSNRGKKSPDKSTQNQIVRRKNNPDKSIPNEHNQIKKNSSSHPNINEHKIEKGKELVFDKEKFGHEQEHSRSLIQKYAQTKKMNKRNRSEGEEEDTSGKQAKCNVNINKQQDPQIEMKER